MAAIRRGLAVAVAVLVLAGALPVPAMSPAPVVLSCVAAPAVPEAQRAAVCDAMAEVLRERLAGARPVHRDVPVPAGALGLRLTLTEATPTRLKAVLGWQADGARGASPPVSADVLDGRLSPRMYLSFCRTLLTRSGVPI